MEIKPALKVYIENHIDEIDNDLTQFFVNAGDSLIEEALGDIIDILESVGIETTNARLNALHQNLDYIFESFDYYGFRRQHLKTWVTEHLASSQCFDYPRVEDYILDHAQEWIQWVKFIKINDDYVITRS